MQNNQLQKAIDLAKKTGDRLIVFDAANEASAYVIMSVDQYKDLTFGRGSVSDLTEEQLIDKINRDIAVWKSENDFGAFEEKKNNKYQNNKTDNVDNYEGYEDCEDEEECECCRGKCEDEDEEYGRLEDMYKNDFSSPGLRNMKTGRNNQERRKNWSIPSGRKQAAEEVIEEDRQYLEDVPF